MGARSPSVAERAKSVILRPGVAMPDWSQVSASAARDALEAIVDVVGLTAKFADLDPLEDAVWQAVLDGYADLGRAPRIPEIATRLGISFEATMSRLRRLRTRDQIVLDETADRITGAYPFTERSTGHRLRLGARELNAMCAIDALAVGAMYGQDVVIASSCRHCGTAVSIRTARRGLALESALPRDSVVWAGTTYANNCAATSLCLVLAFFCSDDHLAAWRGAGASGARGTRLTLDEAMQVGKAIFMPIRQRHAVDRERAPRAADYDRG
jgi:mercuric reductase